MTTTVKRGTQIRSYKDLIVWQTGIDLVLCVYRITHGLPVEEKYGLSAQLRRSALSIPSNIAEGHGRAYRKEYLRFLSHASGSLTELETELLIATRLGYVPEADLQVALGMADEVSRMLGGLRRSLTRKTPSP